MSEESFKAGPESGVEEPESGQARQDGAPKLKLQKRLVMYITTLIWLGINAYVLYGFCYNVLWHDIRPRHKKPAIAILVLIGWLNLHAMVSFVAIHFWGPGKISERYSNDEEPGAAFVCDEDGYQLYCSYCKRLKPNRAHHSAHLDTCVPVMDHFCPWVGNVIGQGNYKFFLQYIWSTNLALLVVMVSLFIYQHHTLPNINGNSIALYCVGGGSMAFLTVMIIQHGFYVAWGHSTLEHMSYRRQRIPYFSISWKDEQREIIQPGAKEIMMPNPSPFSKGLWGNVKDVMGPVYTWPLPVRPKLREPTVCASFVEHHREILIKEREAPV